MARRAKFQRIAVRRMLKKRDFDLFDELVPIGVDWSPHPDNRGCIVFDIDSTLYGTTDGAVRVINEAGVIFAANKNTHRVLKKHSASSILSRR